MKTIKISVIFLSSLLLGGCQNMLKTMVAHTAIDNRTTFNIAKTNAYTNVCLSEKSIDKQQALEFSLVAAELLDLVVFDNDFYKKSYENSLDLAIASSKQGTLGAECKSLDKDLPKITAFLGKNYDLIAQNLSVRRSEENRQLIASMSNFSLPSTPMPQINFPKFEYKQEQPRTQTYLVNTRSGLTQCRVTNNSFVFCL